MCVCVCVSVSACACVCSCGTFESALGLLERHPQLHFAHSTPALYAWIEQHRPALFARIRAAMRSGRWEPINGPGVESDCVLISTASLLRQFQLGQAYSRSRFPEWRHELCWLPDSFGFGAGLPAVAAATGVRWFCTHKLAWNVSIQERSTASGASGGGQRDRDP